jgi:hypothetical protein
MNSYSKPNHGQDTGSTSNPLTFKRPSLIDATQTTINETSYDPHEPHQPSRIKQDFNTPPGESANGRMYDRSSGQLESSHQK